MLRTLLVSLACFFGPFTFAKTVEPYDRLNHCNAASDCLPTRMSDLVCPSTCGRMGILINKKEKDAFVKMRAAAGGNKAMCPQVDCPTGMPVKVTECKFKCVKTKCWLDMAQSAKGC